jgi:transcriptional regulator with XRE-family HTH domain
MPQVNGGIIRDRRRRLGVKLGEFARRVNVKYQTLANIESNQQSGGVSIEVIYRIADGLGCEAGDLLAGACAEDEAPEPKGAAAA